MIFSKRHKESIKKKTLIINIDRNTRTRLIRCLQKYDFTVYLQGETGYNYDEPAIDASLQSLILNEQGWKHLRVWTGAEQAVSSISEFIEFGMPAHVLDAVELYHSILQDNKQDYHSFQQDINRIFTEEKYPWRLLNGKIFKIDSAYLDEELLNDTHSLLQSHGFEGALDEFEQARTHCENGRYRDALTYANHAFESTLKTVLGKKFATKKTGDLIKGLLNSDLIPTYLHQLKSFQDMLEMPPMIRSNSGGHGSGEEKLVVPQEFAEFMLHMCGSLIYFLIKTYISQSSKEKVEEEVEPFDIDDVEPF